MRFVTGLQNLTLTTVFGLDIYPLDEMLRKHRMIYRTHIDMDYPIFNSNSRQMLFAAGFYGVRLKTLHFLTTTHHGNTCVVNHTNQIAAMAANIKLFSHFSFTLIIFFTNFKIGLRMLTYRADFGSCRTDNNMPTIAAFPNRYARLFKYCFGFNIFK